MRLFLAGVVAELFLFPALLVILLVLGSALTTATTPPSAW